MILQIDLTAIHEQLDQTPDDWDARLVLADLYLDLGEEKLATYYRFTANNNIHPKPLEPSRSVASWTWWRNRRKEGSTHYDVSDYYFDKLYGDSGHKNYFQQWPHKFKTRQEAEEALRKVLEANNYQRWEPDE